MTRWERRDIKRMKARRHVRHADFTPQMNAMQRREEGRRVREWDARRALKCNEGVA